MSDINASERRLSAALDRIDQLLEVAGPRPVQPDESETERLRENLAALEAENTRLADELAALRVDRGGPLEAALAETRSRLAGAGEQAARLSAANEELASANRALIEAASGNADMNAAALQALEAEVKALRSARAAEITQMSDIMQELERLMAEEPEPADQTPAARVAGDDAVLPEVTGDGAGVPETESQRDGDR
ncbi:hypothetical protein PAF17_01430 [Paracoccus sp. Z330]|uniref:Colicin transporter n=1 Tax=Paracoccus onchidii TaxID=3017813 RepID=A0ABT4Z9Y9_9RHOB|nr:hypothetical protein [Paracoccus onchidii]MDB6176166.1 hypothetical protein [Paracoccus onchidii]